MVETETLNLFDVENSYARLPERFFARVVPTPVRAPRLVRLNEKLANQLGINPAKLAGPEGVQILAGNQLPSSSEPLAAAYAGHQFGTFVPQLGDGRAILLGELVNRKGERRDIQLKGAGLTPFSRRGDGRAALGPVLREYIVSEAMAALGIPTTRALAAITTGEKVRRESLLPGAVLTRVASSHIRIGTFQYFAAAGDVDAIRRLADYVIARHYPEAADTPNPYRTLLELVISRQAELIASWLLVGFIHGVMNTDNVSIAGETIDYGPCAFMDAYNPGAVYSSIDSRGRYAYDKQPQVAQWNLARFAETLLPLLAEHRDAAVNAAEASLASFPLRFESAYVMGLGLKLGIKKPQSDDLALGQDLLGRMARNSADFTLTFRRLIDCATDPNADIAARELFSEPCAFDEWVIRWRHRLAQEPECACERASVMRAANPAFIPRNHLMEEAISAAIDSEDYSPFENLLEVLSTPSEDQPGRASYAAAPRADQVVHATFCGT